MLRGREDIWAALAALAAMFIITVVCVVAMFGPVMASAPGRAAPCPVSMAPATAFQQPVAEANLAGRWAGGGGTGGAAASAGRMLCPGCSYRINWRGPVPAYPVLCPMCSRWMQSSLR